MFENLKVTAKMVYIPIWIDLKIFNSIKIRKVSKCLHSNMDRFKEIEIVCGVVSCSRLHSNMDRFKDSTFSKSWKINCVYIPIWIDLKHAI